MKHLAFHWATEAEKAAENKLRNCENENEKMKKKKLKMKKLISDFWGLFGHDYKDPRSKIIDGYKDAARLFNKAAHLFGLANLWDKAGSNYIKVAHCRLKAGQNDEAARAYVDAANFYIKINVKEALSCIDIAITMPHQVEGIYFICSRYLEIRYHLERAEYLKKKAKKWLRTCSLVPSDYKYAVDLFNQAIRCFKIAESWDRAASTSIHLANCHRKFESIPAAAYAYLKAARCYGKTNNIKRAVSCLDHALNMYSEKCCDPLAANRFKEQVAAYFAKLEQYERSIEIYEEIAWQFRHKFLLKSGVKLNLVNAALCQLCKGDLNAITNALQ